MSNNIFCAMKGQISQSQYLHRFQAPYEQARTQGSRFVQLTRALQVDVSILLCKVCIQLFQLPSWEKIPHKSAKQFMCNHLHRTELCNNNNLLLEKTQSSCLCLLCDTQAGLSVATCLLTILDELLYTWQADIAGWLQDLRERYRKIQMRRCE